MVGTENIEIGMPKRAKGLGPRRATSVPEKR